MEEKTGQFGPFRLVWMVILQDTTTAFLSPVSHSRIPRKARLDQKYGRKMPEKGHFKVFLLLDSCAILEEVTTLNQNNTLDV
jgi:hypothetical protein